MGNQLSRRANILSPPLFFRVLTERSCPTLRCAATIVLYAELESEDALKAYAPHPVHEQFKELTKPYSTGEAIRSSRKPCSFVALI